MIFDSPVVLSTLAPKAREWLMSDALKYSLSGKLGGEPMVHFGPTAIAGKLEESDTKFESYGERMAQKTKELFG